MASVLAQTDREESAPSPQMLGSGLPTARREADRRIMMLVSPNEFAQHPELREMLQDAEGFPLPYDYHLYTNHGSVAAERKEFPGDFIASVQDGRLARECAAMRQDAEFQVVIIENKIQFTSDGRVWDGQRPGWPKTAVRNLFRSLRYVEGVDLEFTDSLKDTVVCLRELQGYFDKQKHLSIRRRPRLESDWPIPAYSERFVYWLQGCGGKGKVSIVRAQGLARVFRNPMEVMNASVGNLMKAEGIGKVTAEHIWCFLRGLKSVEEAT